MKKIIIVIICIFCNIILKANVHNSKITTKDTSIKLAAKQFLNWYFNVYSNVNDTTFNFHLVSGGDYDTTNPYRIDFKASAKYFNRLQKTGLFSQKFLQSMNNYFIRQDSNFVKHKQYCGEPMGSDGGVLLRYMDDTGIKENINNFKIVERKQKGKAVFLKLQFTEIDFLTFEFTKHNGKWLIDKINGDFPKEIQHNYNYNSGCK